MLPSSAMPAEPVRRRLRRRARAVRRMVLARRRLLAAVLAAGAVAAVIRVAAPPPTPLRLVPVAARDLPAGAVLDGSDVATASVPVALVPPRVAPEPAGRVLTGPIDAGEALTETRLVGETLTDQPPGQVALPVRLGDPAMASLLRVGDRVDLLATDLQGPGAGDASRMVATAVPVLAVPALADRDATGSAGGALTGAQPPGRLIVVAVPAAEVSTVAGSSAASFVTFAWSGT